MQTHFTILCFCRRNYIHHKTEETVCYATLVLRGLDSFCSVLQQLVSTTFYMLHNIQVLSLHCFMEYTNSYTYIFIFLSLPRLFLMKNACFRCKVQHGYTLHIFTQIYMIHINVSYIHDTLQPSDNLNAALRQSKCSPQTI